MGWISTFPLDLVKTRVQENQPGITSIAAIDNESVTMSLLGERPDSAPQDDTNPYRSTWSTIVYSYRTEGLGVFFRGLAPTVIR